MESIVTDPSGAIWFSCESFVSRYDGVSWQSWYSDVTGGSRSRLFVDREGQVWLYGRGDSMARFANGNWQIIPVDALIGDDRWAQTTGVVVDAAGRFWLARSGRLVEYTPPREADAISMPAVRQGRNVESRASFQTFATTTQTGVFTCTFEASPIAAITDGVTGLCAEKPLSFYDLAVITRFNSDGRIDARDGSAYRSDEVIPYTPGEWYCFRLVVDIPRHLYDAYVTPPDGIERVIGRGLAFRTELGRVPHLDRWTLWAGTGTHLVRNMRIQ